MMADDGWKKLTPQEFIKRIQPQPLVDHPLERRLASAQSFGLADNLRRQLAFLGDRGPILEIEVLGYRRNSGDNFPKTRAAHAAANDEEIIRLCAEADGWGLTQGIYILPARLKGGVETRHASPGTWFDIPKDGGTTDSDVDARLILAVDFDVDRPKGTSATDEELRRSIGLSLLAWKYLSSAFGGEECMAYIHSGNGRQIHLALDYLPNDEPSKVLAAGLLVGLDTLLSTSQVKVDRKLYDAKRILPACGTVKKKGSAGVESRPHRRTAIVTPPTVRRLSADELRELARKIWNDTSDAGRAAMNEAFGIREKVSPISPPSDSPFGAANAVSPEDVAQWLNLYDGQDVRCPGCGETSGVAVLQYGLKCHHNRCSAKGRNGFRTNVDLVVEVRSVSPRDAVLLLAERFVFDTSGLGTYTAPESSPSPPTIPQQTPPPMVMASLNDILGGSIERAQRRCDGVENSIPLPWPSLLPHYGGGLWPGVHFLCSGTGVGKTAAALQIGLSAAEAGIPTGYIGLEMEAMQIALRLIGEHGQIPWSTLYTGQATPDMMDSARAAALSLMEKNLPFHPLFARPQGWPASEMQRTAEALRAKYPEPDGPGSRPLLMILDFLQLVGDEQNQETEIRTRISRASYVARHMASKLNMVVLVISSIARDKYTVIANAAAQSGLTFDVDSTGLPINRKIKNPDALVGLGKESGDIEFSADSVSAIARIPDSDDMLWITAKGRATGATWSPMRFTGFRYEEPLDGGRGVALAFQGAEQQRAEVKATSEKEKLHKTVADAILVIRHIQQNPTSSVRAVRTLLADSSARWKGVKDLLGIAMVHTKGSNGSKDSLSIVVPELPELVREVLTVTNGSQIENSGSYRGDRGSTVDPRSSESVEAGGVDPWIGSALKGRPSAVPPSTVGSTVDKGQKKSKRGSTVADVNRKEEMYDMMRQAQLQGIDPGGFAAERAPEMGWTDEDINDGLRALSAGRPEETLAQGSEGGGAPPELVDTLVRLVGAQPNITRQGLEQAMGVDVDPFIEQALAEERIRIVPVNSVRTFVVEPEKS